MNKGSLRLKERIQLSFSGDLGTQRTSLQGTLSHTKPFVAYLLAIRYVIINGLLKIG